MGLGEAADHTTDRCARGSGGDIKMLIMCPPVLLRHICDGEVSEWASASRPGKKRGFGAAADNGKVTGLSLSCP